jgi:Spy/CpxP family protein refolding chaperone
MKKTTVLLAFVLSIGTVLAQQGPPPMGPGWGPPPGGPAWGAPNLDALKTFLQLSDQQVQSITALQTSFRDAVKPIHEQIMTKQEELRQEMAKASPDSAVVAQLMVDAKNLRSQIKTKRDEQRPQFLALLSDAQKISLSNLQQALSLQQAAHQAAALGLIDAPQGEHFGGPGFGGMRRGMHQGQIGQP